MSSRSQERTSVGNFLHRHRDVLLTLGGLILTFSQAISAWADVAINERLADLEEARDQPRLRLVGAQMTGINGRPEILLAVTNEGLAGTDLSTVHLRWRPPGLPGMGYSEFPTSADGVEGSYVGAGQRRQFLVDISNEGVVGRNNVTLELSVNPVRGSSPPLLVWDEDEWRVNLCRYWEDKGVPHDFGYADGHYFCDAKAAE